MGLTPDPDRWKPSAHRDFPYHTFCAKCDLYMPQVYWGDCDTGRVWAKPKDLLARTLAEFKPYQKLYPHVAFCPTGAIARKESGADPALVRAFCDAVDGARLGGANFWDWQEATEETWAAMAAWHPKGGR